MINDFFKASSKLSVLCGDRPGSHPSILLFYTDYFYPSSLPQSPIYKTGSLLSPEKSFRALGLSFDASVLETGRQHFLAPRSLLPTRVLDTLIKRHCRGLRRNSARLCWGPARPRTTNMCLCSFPTRGRADSLNAVKSRGGSASRAGGLARAACSPWVVLCAGGHTV